MFSHFGCQSRQNKGDGVVNGRGFRRKKENYRMVAFEMDTVGKVSKKYQTGSGVNYGLTKEHITPLSYF